MLSVEFHFMRFIGISWINISLYVFHNEEAFHTDLVIKDKIGANRIHIENLNN